MAVDATQIANLLAIARTGSFTRAAAEKGMSQPALSNSIALLERRLGVPVLTRSRRGSELTPYGEILVRRAEGLQALLTDAETEVRRRVDGVAGPLRIGATPSVIPTLLADTLIELIRDGDPVDIEILDGLDQTLVPMLRSGAIDVIIGPVGEMFMSSDDVVERVLMQDPFAVAVGLLSPFRQHTAVTLAELADAPWILPRPGSTYRSHVEALFMTAGLPWPRNCILANSLQLLETVVASSDRVTIVSPIQRKQADGALTVIPLADAGSRTIGYKVRASGRLSALGERLVSLLSDNAAARMPTDRASTDQKR
ncbi:LysR family transcriptional regulator [Sphingomonas sp. GC_Shp_3]|uniref:LysR family transcriptional regulator n=1 Tax=Sphingomonas sp. GC_Shp_3 TaxID=2937383 RepID=UPI002269EC00|nr:LysR family transcriptional regulator [Sphingomonas sp. GC_Shp_3]